MRNVICGTIPALAAAALCAGAAVAQDAADDEVIFDNALPAGDVGTFMQVDPNGSASDALFAAWQIAYQDYSDAMVDEADRTEDELAALADASNAAAAAYEAALMAQNVVMLTAGGPELLTDEMVAEVQAVYAE